MNFIKSYKKAFLQFNPILFVLTLVRRFLVHQSSFLYEQSEHKFEVQTPNTHS